MVRLLVLCWLAFGTLLDCGTSRMAWSAEMNDPTNADGLPVPRLLIPELFRSSTRRQVAGDEVHPVIRGQNAPIFETPPIMAPSNSATTPFSGAMGQDPFIYGPDPVLGAPPSSVLSGVNGPQPYRFGFTPRFDYTFLAPSGAKSPGSDKFGVNAFDFELAYTTPLAASWIFTSTPQAGFRLWDGPGVPDLPSTVYRLGWDFTLATPINGPWSMQLDFNPSFNSDFENSPNGDAWNIDGNAMLFYRSSPQWMFVIGAGYWDRVDGLVIPYAGVVWNPNDLWELRLMSPKSRISYFLGNFGTAAHWLYASGEYHVESYQIDSPGVGRNQVQLEDWRVGLGLRSDHGWYDKSLEIGYVFGRNVKYRDALPDFDIKNTLMIHYGVRF